VYGIFEDDRHFYTLMEFGCDGQLYNLIKDKKKLTEEGTSFITKNLLQAVDYMHSHNILHRDIKPENIVRIMVHLR
jgi:serine/threonine protein kinase